MATPASDLNIDLLIKMMGMSQSDNDGQTLVAIRKANALVAKIDGGWDALLRGKVTVIADPFAAATPPPSTNSSWTPHTTRRQPTPPPSRPDPYTSTAPQRPSPSPKPAFTPPPPPQQQTPGAVVQFTKRAGQWILKSDRPLIVSIAAEVSRKDGKKDRERVGTLIHQDQTGYYYNIEGKTNFQALSSLSI